MMEEQTTDRAEPRRDGTEGLQRWLGVTAIVLVAVLAGGSAATLSGVSFSFDSPAEAAPKPASFTTPAMLGKIATYTVDDQEQIVVEGELAEARNEKLPFAAGPLEAARQFQLATAGTSAQAAQRCLSQAVYYEAAFEPMQGRRAVAQVVLNRVRHPAYPASVCGVVYQGHTRRTGCQFSFTCDGSLLRKPAAGAWAEAEKVAREALTGAVETSVGTATHYHADYVLPRWAFQLGKLNKIGRHIFYRFPGRAGSSGAFSARYTGLEMVPEINRAALLERAAEFAEIEPEYTPGLTVTPHVTDRHAPSDVGGRLDTTKEWRLSIPDPVNASSRLREVIDETGSAAPAPAGTLARAETERGKAVP